MSEAESDEGRLADAPSSITFPHKREDTRRYFAAQSFSRVVDIAAAAEKP